MAWLGAKFNAYFGSNVTHIANAFEGDAWITIYSEERQLDDINLNFVLQNAAPSANLGTVLRNNTRVEWIRIPRNDFHKKYRDQAVDYITVIVEGENGPKLIVDKYKLFANESVIITKNGGLKYSKYGGSIWEER